MALSPTLRLRVERFSNSELRLSWDASGDPNLHHYAIYADVTDSSSFIDRVDSDTKSFLHSGLKKKTTYYYQVAARDQAGNFLEITNRENESTAKYSFEEIIIAISLSIAIALLVPSIFMSYI